MVELSVNVPEIRSFLNQIVSAPSKLFDVLRQDVRQSMSRYLNQLMEAEITVFLGRGRYERVKGGRVRNHRNGAYPRQFTIKGIGGVSVTVPRDRLGKHKTAVLPRYQRYENKIKEDLSLMFLTGVSTRTTELISKRLLGRSLSHTEVSLANQELTQAVEAWRTRDLSSDSIKYLYLDGVNFDMRIERSIQNVPVLVAIGVDENGIKHVIGMQSGDKESAGNWREFFKDLKQRGLKTQAVRLGIMDGLSGLEKVFLEEFPKAKVQGCQVHVARNVLAKVPRVQKQAVADDLRSIFYASSYKKAKEQWHQFHTRWEKDLPSATRCLSQSLEKCLTFYKFPQEEWISIRTTNIIERLNKEFKRRTKPMEIVAGEASCYRLLAFIAIKMELAWRKTPVGKAPRSLPWFNKFTQDS
ncbi:MAG: IS256 family transposase [Nitrospiria bacterium]